MLRAIVKATRPHQWIKNGFVAAPLVFAMRMRDKSADLRTAAALASFCLLSSAVYLWNDLVDVEKDRAHPLKRFRPIASGALPIPVARRLAPAFALLALSAGLWLGAAFAVCAASYLALNLAYSFTLKKLAFIDVLAITLGFLLRVLAGAAAIPVQASGWLLGCTLLLASFLAFGKRAHELRVAGERGGAQRDVLGKYHPGVLRSLLYLLALATLATYSAYTQSAHALSFFGTRYLAFTIPFAAFGLARFLTLTLHRSDAESPTDAMLHDLPFILNLVLYSVAIVAIIYLH